MQLLGEPKVHQFGQHKTRIGPNPVHLPPGLRARNDNSPLPHLIAHKEYGHEAGLRPPPPPQGVGAVAGAGPNPGAGPHIMRREFNTAPLQHQANGYHYDFSKLTRFAHAKDTPVLDVAKNQFFRPESNQHQHQQHNNVYKYPSEQYIQNFKASPQFNGNVIHKDQQFPVGGSAPPHYTPIQQHAIPVQASQYTQVPKFYGEGNSYSIVPSKQTQKGSDSFGYSVHESESDNASKENGLLQTKNYHQQQQQQQQHVQQHPPQQQQQQQHHHHQIPPPNSVPVSKEAQDYLHFMSTNEYFLPKHEPNYKQLDAEQNQQKLYQQQKQTVTHSVEHYKQLDAEQTKQKFYQPQKQQTIHGLEQQRPTHHFPGTATNLRLQLDNSVSSTYNKPIQVQDLFYQQDPNPSSNAAVVRGSYQTGQDVFVVKSDGNKAVKHVVSTPLASKPSTQTAAAAVTAASYNQDRRNRYQTNTPEPLRFEFTEKDAISGGGASTSYTHSPQGQKFYYETSTITSTPRPTTLSDATIAEVAKPIKEYTDEADAEDSADISQRPNEDSSSLSNGNAKDTESYCEKICANVYDENDEIVCGSDGYMYTGEPQLECYSSCLNISVTIKSKGSCV
ncbi:ataxin-2 homolog [Drosophila tropicalis]|uniref:ataxin-2 homolog n=1 Tax=Drosophila tropicalis TaxID=46794 RepID=UPI0035ABA65D